MAINLSRVQDWEVHKFQLCTSEIVFILMIFLPKCLAEYKILTLLFIVKNANRK